MRALTELYNVTPETRLDPAFLNGLIREVHARISDLQILKSGLEAAIKAAQDIALARVTEIIGPAQDDLAARLDQAQTALEAAQTALAGLLTGQVDPSQVTGLVEALAAKASVEALDTLTTAVGTKATPAQIDTAIATAARWRLLSATATAVAGERIAADVSGGSWTLTLPASPAAGDAVTVAVIEGDAGADPLTIDGGAADVQGDATLVLDVPLATVVLIFDGTEWRIA